MNSTNLFKFIASYCIFLIISNASGFPFSNNYTRFRRQANCGFKCKTSGECIVVDQECDGIKHCKDGSDESDNCSDLSCPGYLFQCKYGACIEENKVCNGKKDCNDNSDEANCNGDTTSSVNGNCKYEEFKCKSGECISIEKQCNGIAECSDKSDETIETCGKLDCPGYLYRCAYGACVNGNAECNKVQECLDNSDEEPTKCGGVVNVTEPVSSGCMLPNHPQNGQWVIKGNSVGKNPGEAIHQLAVLEYKCNSDYQLISKDKKFQLCDGKVWAPVDIPTCERSCPPIPSTATTIMQCKLNGINISCTEAVEGTRLTYTCADYYEVPGERFRSRICNDGSWSSQKPSCVPVCGQKNVNARPLVVGGNDVIRGNYPWQVAIYKKKGDSYSHICGGSLLTERVIVSAAHCFANKDGDLLNINDYRVSVGKYYRSYNSSLDKNSSQFQDLHKIYLSNEYRGQIQHYVGDLSILVTKDKFNFSDYVQPVCLSTDGSNHLTSNDLGVVTGWGYTTESSNPSDVLKELSVPYQDDSSCKSYLPHDWQKRYFTHDKMCAGYYNKSVSVCRGDSGGGLVFQNLRNERFYIHGIVSVSTPTDIPDSCNSQQYTLYTKVFAHINFVDDKVVLYEKT